MKNLVGQRFGRWTVVEFEGLKWPNTYQWLCRCECGVEKVVNYSALSQGSSKSCGCLRRELLVKRHVGAERSNKVHPREYRIWLDMKTRCKNLEHPSSKNHGQRGIKVCERWDESFEAFFEDMGEAPAGLSIDRKENDGNYEPGNCRWADRYEQATNRRNNQRVMWKGEVRTFTDVARMEGVAFCSFRNLMVLGLACEEAVNECRRRGLKYKERAKMFLKDGHS